MSITQITDNIGKPDNAYAIVSLLSASTNQQVSNLLTQLSSALGEIVWIMPKDALHITLCEIIQAKVYQEVKQVIYDRHSSEYENVTANILRKFDPIRIIFDTIEVSPQAIIIKGNDDGSFQKIRKVLIDMLPLPSETKLPPNIIHISIARFTKEVQLNEIEKIVEKYTISIHETITEFQLVNNLTPPLLSYEVIRTYPLSKRFQ